MRRTKSSYLLISAFLIMAALPSYGEVVDKIAIVVNNEMITQSEIDRLMGPIYMQYRTIYQGDQLIKKLDEARQRIMEDLIDEKIMISEAKKLKIEIDERMVDAKIEEAVRRVGSKEKFEKALSEQHLALKDLKERYREQLMMRKIIDRKIGSSITTTPVEISNYYDTHVKEFVQPEEIKLRNILIKPKPELGIDKASNLANEVMKRLKGGDDFATLAKIYSEGPGASEGGAMGYVKKGDLLPEIENYVFKMKEGETSEILQTPLGYHIFKVEEKREAKMLTLSEVRRDIEEEIFKEKVKEKIKGWVQGLKKNAYIAFK